MKPNLVFILIFASLAVNAQGNYSTLTEKALHTMWKAKDSIAYRKAFDMYEDAFKQFTERPLQRNGLFVAFSIEQTLRKSGDGLRKFHQQLPDAFHQFDVVGLLAQ